MDQQASPPSPWELLPAELLAEIFSYLSPVQLERVRLTCHRWNRVVCHTPALMAQFELWFVDSTPFNADHHEQSKMAANVTGRYSTARVELGNSRPKKGSPLWAKIGETIQRLTVDVWRSIDPLIDLLRLTPNLKTLILRDGVPDWMDLEISQETRTVDFKLEHLTELNFSCEFVDLFCQICPNLQVLNQRFVTDPYEVDCIVPLIQATCYTLQKLSLANTYLNPDKFREICSLDRLHLKELSLTLDWQDPWLEMESFMSLISKQPSLEFLRLEPMKRGGIDRYEHDCNPQTWSVIKETLPNLKSFDLTVEATHLAAFPTFLNDWPQLECLGIRLSSGFEIYLNLSAYSNPYLTRLEMTNVWLNPEDLSIFFAQTPNIRHLIFNSVSIADLRSISCLKQLENLEIISSKISYPDNASCVLNSVKTLMCSTLEVDILTVCPNVQNLTSQGHLTDDIVLVLVQKLKRLKRLNLLHRSNITAAALDHIIEHGHTLERLQIQLKEGDILPEKLALLRKTVRVRVLEVPYQGSINDDMWSTGTSDSEEME